MSHPRQPYTKAARSPQDLLIHLQAKGLGIPNPANALHALQHIGYYRLLIYMRPLQDHAKQFLPGTQFENILTLYNFDRELRLLCLDAIERIEVALRSCIVNQLTVSFGPHFYLESRHFESISGYQEFLRDASKAKYLAVFHYYKKYNEPSLAPIWAIMEAITFGTLSRFYSCLHIKNRKSVARCFGFHESVLVSWFRSLNALRNACAHHNRLWNAHMVVDQPLIARKLAVAISQTDKFYARAVVLVALLNRIEPGSAWRNKLKDLMNRYPTVNPQALGFPPNWQVDPFWA